MPEIQLGAHTIRSHGVTVARFHMHDWLILLLLIVIEVVLNVIEPFHRFVGEDMLTDLRYPLQDNTVPFWAVPVNSICGFSEIYLILDPTLITLVFVSVQLIAVVLPFAVISVYYFIRRDVYDLHHAILGTSSVLFFLMFQILCSSLFIRCVLWVFRSVVFCAHNWCHNRCYKGRCR